MVPGVRESWEGKLPCIVAIFCGRKKEVNVRGSRGMEPYAGGIAFASRRYTRHLLQ
jgi:hypothetical protein